MGKSLEGLNLSLGPRSGFTPVPIYCLGGQVDVLQNREPSSLFGEAVGRKGAISNSARLSL